MSWATLRTHVDKKGMVYGEAKKEALSTKGVGKTFRRLDKDADGKLTSAEVEASYGGHEATSMISFHDLNEDGVVTREEFAEAFAMWAATQKAVIDETPKKYRKFQWEDMEGDFN